MAELIVKSALLKDWKKLPVQKVELVSCDDIYRNRPLCDLALVYEMITNAPTTTEAEIRAKAIDDVFEFLKSKRDNRYMNVNFDDLEIRKYKEQLKEE